MKHRIVVLLPVLALVLAAQDRKPRPDRTGVTNTGPYGYGVMGPPASRCWGTPARWSSPRTSGV